jgi:hypothetical protein
LRDGTVREICGICTKILPSLIDHLKNHIFIDKKTSPCKKCHQFFTKKFYNLRHNTDNNKTFVCKPCRYIYKCNKCNLAFKHFETLKIHKTIHTHNLIL